MRRFREDADIAHKRLQDMQVGVSMTWHSHQQHPPESAENQEVSWWSDTWNMLHRSEWYFCNIEVNVDGADLDPNTSMTVYHGTEWGAAFQIVAKGQGFIPGEGTHAKRGRSYSGMFCTETLPDAFQRANPSRYMRNGQYTRWCTPVVLELRTSHLVNLGPTKRVKPGETGVKLQGIEFVRIHFHLPAMQNFMRLERQVIRQIFCTDWRARTCACGLCGNVTHAASDDFWQWRKSNSNQWYSGRCYRRVCVGGMGRVWL